MLNERFAKRLAKKAKKGFRGHPIATIAFYGPNLARDTKVVVGIVRREGGEAEETRTWLSEARDVRHDATTGKEILEFIDGHGALSVAMIDRCIGCPHQEGIDYEC